MPNTDHHSREGGAADAPDHAVEGEERRQEGRPRDRGSGQHAPARRLASVHGDDLEAEKAQDDAACGERRDEGGQRPTISEP